MWVVYHLSLTALTEFHLAHQQFDAFKIRSVQKLIYDHGNWLISDCMLPPRIALGVNSEPSNSKVLLVCKYTCVILSVFLNC